MLFGNHRVAGNQLEIYSRITMVHEVTEKTEIVETAEKKRKTPTPPRSSLETAFGCPRDFLDNRFVYLVVSSRARGLSVGVNMNPDRNCNFNCVYCEVDRTAPLRESRLDVEAMAQELKSTLAFVRGGHIREQAGYRNLPDELLQLKHVALSGDGEPTFSPDFAEAVQAVV